MSAKLPINQWPDSQNCIGCKSAVFIPIGYGDSAYGCQKDLEAGEDCPGFKEATPEEWHKKF